VAAGRAKRPLDLPFGDLQRCVRAHEVPPKLKHQPRHDSLVRAEPAFRSSAHLPVTKKEAAPTGAASDEKLGEKI
jgi:hypothetical protein